MTSIKSRLGWISIAAASLIPVIIWLSMKPVAERFASGGATLLSLGQLSGLLGMTLFSVVLILSGRFKSMEVYFGGLNQIYIIHHILGAVSFMLLLFHPIFLALRYAAFSWKLAASFLLPGSNDAVNYGLAALGIMIFSLVVTFFANWRYQNWKISHKLLGLSFFFAGLHSLFIASDISRNQFLRFYILSLAMIGILCIIYRVLLSKFLVKYFEYEVAALNRLSDTIVEVEMLPKNHQLDFESGQFVFVSFINGNISSESHPFSISSGRQEKTLKLTIKALGDYTQALPNLRLGATAKIEGPFGVFTGLKFQNPKQLWIAGGIGVTPFLSMAKSLQGNALDIKLLYCVKERSEAVYQQILEDLCSKNSQLECLLFCSNEQGYMSAESVKQAAPDIFERDIFVCGPPAMMKSLKEQFIKLGVQVDRIHTEEFQIN